MTDLRLFTTSLRLALQPETHLATTFAVRFVTTKPVAKFLATTFVAANLFVVFEMVKRRSFPVSNFAFGSSSNHKSH